MITFTTIYLAAAAIVFLTMSYVTWGLSKYTAITLGWAILCAFIVFVPYVNVGVAVGCIFWFIFYESSNIVIGGKR